MSRREAAACTEATAFRYSSNASQRSNKPDADNVAKRWFFSRQSEQLACRETMLKRPPQRLAHDARPEKHDGFSLSRVGKNLPFSAAWTLCCRGLATAGRRREGGAARSGSRVRQL